MEEYLPATTTTEKLSYEELCRQRRSIENEIAVQEQYLADAARQLIKPHNVIKAISGVVFDNVVSGFSLFDTFNNARRWLRMAMRLIRRFT